MLLGRKIIYERIDTLREAYLKFDINIQEGRNQIMFYNGKVREQKIIILKAKDLQERKTLEVKEY
jgi:hypothetical protein